MVNQEVYTVASYMQLSTDRTPNYSNKHIAFWFYTYGFM